MTDIKLKVMKSLVLVILRQSMVASLSAEREKWVAVCDLPFTPANGYAEEFYSQSDKS